MQYPISDPGSQLHNNKFTDGDPSQGVAASKDKAAHMNAVYDELLSVISGLGLTPNEGNLGQLMQAINIAAPPSQVTFQYVNLNDADPVPGWLLCDGTNGTPDLTDRFVVGAGGGYDVGDIGGQNSKNTSSAGSHNHTITINGRTLTEAQLAQHFHLGGFAQGSTVGIYGSTDLGAEVYPGNEGADSDNDLAPHTSSVGSNTAHNHTASSGSGGSHVHTVDVRPPYFALAPFIRADYIASVVQAGGL